MDSVNEVDWSKYATQYDSMAALNPAYDELKQEVSRVFSEYFLPEDGAILDLGAGTGNFTELLLDQLPQRRFVLADNNEVMIDIALDKFTGSARRVEALCCDAFDIRSSLRGQKVAGTIMVHSLYAMGNKNNPDRPVEILQQIYDLMEPNGLFVIIDCGRLMNILSWTIYALKHVYLRTGSIMEMYKLVRDNQEVIRQNRAVTRQQRAGDFYMHTLGDFESAVSSVGFKILESSDKLFRGYDDFVVARK